MLDPPNPDRPPTAGPGTAVQPCAAQPGRWLCLPRADVSLNFATDISSIGMSDINRELHARVLLWNKLLPHISTT